MTYQRSKAPLALMEQIIMILVFALAAAVCLQAFVYSDTLSKQGERRDLAVNRAQEVAEYCKAQGGDLDQVSAMMQAERTMDGLKLVSDGMSVILRVEQSDEYMEKAKISVLGADGEEIYSIPIAWNRRGNIG